MNAKYFQEFIDLPASQFVSNRTVSLLQFNLHSERDYGTVQCWAQNSIGRQIEPCFVQLVRKGASSIQSKTRGLILINNQKIISLHLQNMLVILIQKHLIFKRETFNLRELFSGKNNKSVHCTELFLKLTAKNL